MERIQGILQDQEYQEYVAKIAQWEEGRIYCRHDLAHFLDVARIATIMCQEQQIAMPRDIIYATALLHDIGRFMQYDQGTPHELASHKLAGPILVRYGFDQTEQEVILQAILAHREVEGKSISHFSGCFAKADKLSRACYHCMASDTCHWKHKNDRIMV